jgi:hypothetical protein
VNTSSHFNYFTEIEEHFQRRRGTILLLSTLDWALIETWKDAGIPLEAVLRGIDTAFEKFDKRPRGARKVNSLGYCAQAVLAEAEDMKEATVGVARDANAGMDREEIAAYLRRNSAALLSAEPKVPASAQNVVRDAAQRLAELAASVGSTGLEDLERVLTVLEEKIFAALTAAASDSELIEARAQAEREMAPYRRSMTAAQIEQLQKQYVHKRLLERASLPRLSLFYM